MKPIVHGASYGDYQRCRRTPTGPCTPCKAKSAEYMRNHRHNNPDLRAKERRDSAVRWRALDALAKRYPVEYRALVEEEWAREQQRQEAGAA